MAVNEELQQQVLNRNCSPARQVKVEPSAAIIHAQTDEIYHLKGPKTALQLAFLLGKKSASCWLEKGIFIRSA